MCKSVSKLEDGFQVELPDGRIIKCKSIVELGILLHNLAAQRRTE